MQQDGAQGCPPQDGSFLSMTSILHEQYLLAKGVNPPIPEESVLFQDLPCLPRESIKENFPPPLA